MHTRTIIAPVVGRYVHFFIGAALLMSGFFMPTAANAAITLLNLTAPDGSEMWRGTQTITWSGVASSTDTIDITYAADGVNFNQLVATSVLFSDGAYSWNTLSFAESSTARIHISPSGFPLLGDSSTNVFMVDNTAPATTYASSQSPDPVTGWYNIATGVPTITLSCADGSGSGCNATYYLWDDAATTTYGGAFVAAEGVHTLRYYSDDHATDSIGERNVEIPHTLEVKVDTIAPTLVTTMSDAALKAGDTSLVTFTFSEAVTDFANTNITVIGNGMLTPVSSADGGITWMAIFTPTADIENATNVITVDTAGVVDIAGNAGSGTTDSPNYAIDTILPTAVSVVMSDIALQIGDTSTITFTFSEAVTGFDGSDVTVENGTIGAVSSADGITWTTTFLPTADVEDSTNTVTVGAVWTDLAGNAPLAGAISANYTIDTKAPTAAITYSDADALVKMGDSLTITATFSEPLAGAPVVQIAISGVNTQASIDMTMVDSTHYTYTHTVGAGDGPATIALSVGTDVAGNEITSAPTGGATFTVDNTPPVVFIASIADDDYINDGEKVAVHVVGTAEADSTVSVTLIDGVTTVGPVTGTATGGAFDITLDVATLADGTITPSVTATDAAGNTSAPETMPTAIKDIVAPTVASITTKDANTNGTVDTATIVFSETMKDSTFVSGAWTIGGTAATAFTSGIADDATVDVSHTGIAGTNVKDVLYAPGTVTDLAGNPLAAVASGDVTEADEAKPILLSAETTSTANIDTVWSEDLGGGTVNPSGNEFTLDGGYVVSAASETAPGIVTLTTSAMSTDATPVVTFTSSNFEDLAGNDAPSPQDVIAVDGVAPTLSGVTIKSDNDADTLSPEWAKVGDTATLSFTSSEPIATPTITIDGMPATTITNPSGNDWVATYTFVGGEADGTILFSIAFADVVAPTPNTGTTVIETDDGSSVFLDEVVPIVDAGTDKEVNALVAQDATISDAVPASGVNTYAWTQVSGPVGGIVTFSNVSGTGTSVDTNLTADKDGTYTLRLTATDNAGNEASDEMTFIWDTKAPFVVSYSPITGAINVPITAGTATVRFNEDIALLDAAKVALVNNATDTSVLGTPTVDLGNDMSPTLNLPYVALANGTTYRANIAPEAVRDTAGNIFALSFVNHFTTEADITAPVVTSFTAGTTTTTGAFLSVSTDEPALCRYSTVDSAYGLMTPFTTTGTVAHSQTITGLTAATSYHYYVRCADTSPAANVMPSSASVSFTTLPDVDSTAPATPVITTVPATIDADTYTIAGTAASDGGIRTLRLYNGATEVASISLPAGQTTWATVVSLTQETANVFTVTSADVAGNMSAASASVTIAEAAATGDATDPETPVITTTDTTVDADTYAITGTAGADLPTDGARTITILRNDTVVGSLSLAAGTIDWSFVAPLVQNADNSFTAHSTDTAGNVSDASANVTITEENADTTAPTVSSTDPADGATDIAVDAVIHILFSEALDAATVSSATVQLHDDNDDSVSATITLAEGSTEALITPIGSLDYSADYHVDVTSDLKDAAGNAFADTDTVTTFTTENVPADTTTPTITDIRATAITHNSVTVTWTTDEDSGSQVEYGTTSAYGSLTAVDSTMVTSHSVTISGLSENTVFHFRVKSKDAALNEDVSADNVFQTALDDAVATLAVTGIDAVRSFATADDTFGNGWSWTFHVTVPTSETGFAMKFADFISGANTIAAANNIRYYSAQSSTASTTASAMTIASANTYPPDITLDSDLDSGTAGRQIAVIVEMKVPVGSAGGSYSAQYGVKSI